MIENRTITNAWIILCPACRSGKLEAQGDNSVCDECRQNYVQSDGVVYLSDLVQNPTLDGFVRNYKRIRAAEGYVGHKSEFYRNLPGYPKAGPEADIWHIRRRSYLMLMKHLNESFQSGAKILDLGSGNGWLSHQLSLHDYLPCAIDINDDWDDGLRGQRHYPFQWPALLSSFDSLPFEDTSVDAVIFNGSFHYSENQSNTLEEAKRVLRPGGQIIIMDSPVYSDPDSGRQMMAERARYHQKSFNYQSEIDVSGYLTWQGAKFLAGQHEMVLTVLTPWYGIKWALRPLWMRLLGSRQPARFAIIVLKLPEIKTNSLPSNSP